MADESENEYNHLMERLYVTDDKGLIVLHNRLYGVIRKKMNLKEKYTLEALLEIECELTKREM